MYIIYLDMCVSVCSCGNTVDELEVGNYEFRMKRSSCSSNKTVLIIR